MATKLWAIGLIVLCTAFTSIAQVFYKIGAKTLEFDILSLITNVPLIIGMVLYGIGAVLMIIAFKGGEVSVLYPIIATSYIWVTLLSFYLFNESINVLRVVGILLIVFGVVFVSIGSKSPEVVEAL